MARMVSTKEIVETARFNSSLMYLGKFIGGISADVEAAPGGIRN